MNISEYDNDFKMALQKWGQEAQENMAMEECSELIKALLKNRRRYNSTSSIDDIIDEIADVTIMIRQMSIIFGTDKVDERIQYKIDRLKKLLYG